VVAILGFLLRSGFDIIYCLFEGPKVRFSGKDGSTRNYILEVHGIPKRTKTKTMHRCRHFKRWRNSPNFSHKPVSVGTYLSSPVNPIMTFPLADPS